MTESEERRNRDMLRVRDAIDRDFQDVDIEALARLSARSPDSLIRSFAATFGETPHRYLQRRRLERAMAMLRTTELSVTEICLEVGYTSLGAFSELFTAVVGVSPSRYREEADDPPGVLHRFALAWSRPSSYTHPSISRKRAPRTPD